MFSYDKITHQGTKLSDRTLITIPQEASISKNEKTHHLPWLDSENPRSKMMNKNTRNESRLRNTCSNGQKESSIYNLLEKHKECFNLCEEIGTCPHIKAVLELKDNSQFLVQPYAIKEQIP